MIILAKSAYHALQSTTPSATADHAYGQDGQYLVDLTATDGAKQGQFATIDNPVPTLASPGDSYAASGQPFSVTASLGNLSSVLAPVAFVDWGDGTGPHQAAVSGNTITASSLAAPAHGVYTATLTLYPMGPTGSGGGGPTYAVTTSFSLYVWGIVIGDGSAHQVLMASPTGTQNLQPVNVYFPHPAGPSLNLTLTGTDNAEDDLWPTATPAATDTPLLGGNVTSDAISTSDASAATYYVGATAGDTTPGVCAFNLGGMPSGGSSTSGGASSSISAATQPVVSAAASDGQWKIEIFNDPNGQRSNGQDVTGESENLLVGQVIDLEAFWHGPPAPPASANGPWWFIPGSTT